MAPANWYNLYPVTPSPWEWLYTLLLVIDAILLFIPIAIRFNKQTKGDHAPLWILLPAGIGISILAYGAFPFFVLHLLLYSQASIGASLLVSIMSLFTLYAILCELGLTDMYKRLRTSEQEKGGG